MHKLLRYYSQNRIKVWTMILGVIFIIVVIQVLNNVSKNQIEEDNIRKETTLNDVVSYENESQSIISDGSVPEIYREDLGQIIDEFYTYCINHEPQKAYEMLAPDTIRALYETESMFERLYYNEKFEGNKEYSFQSWTRIDDNYVYQIKIFDNMLTSGKKNDEYIEDYITVVPYEGTYRLNINSFTGRKEINKSNSNDLITMNIAYADVYMDYEIYTIRIKNNTDNEIILDTRENTDTVFLVDNKNNKFESFLYENNEQDLILKEQEAKTIQIKFNDAYRNSFYIESINFTDININGQKQEEFNVEI